jgi:outer membrane protein assembly factor BamB
VIRRIEGTWQLVFKSKQHIVGVDARTGRELWRHRDASLFTSSPVVVGDRVVGFSHLRSGQLFGLDPADGAVLWRGAPRAGEHASLISCGDTLLALQDDGWLVAGRVTSDGLQAPRRH